MRVAILGDYPIVEGKVDGGVQAVIFYLIKELARIRDLDVHVITCKREIDQDKSLYQDGVNIHFLTSMDRLNLVTGYAADKKKIQQKVEEIHPDLIHAQNAGKYGYIGLNLGYPAVITLHGILREDSKYFPTFRDRVRMMLNSLLIEKYCVKNSKHIIVISNYVTEYFKDLIKGNTYYIPNPVDEKFFGLNTDGINNRLLFAGKVQKRKGLLYLLQALHEVNKVNKGLDFSLHIAGVIEDERYFYSLQDYVCSNNLEDKVKFLGLLREDELIKEYKECSVLLLTSYQETAPMVIIQAMAAGKPVVATNVGGVSDLIEDGETGFLINCDDIMGLVDKINLLLGNPEKRRIMGSKARKKAKQEFRASVIAQKTYEVYSYICER
jgi:glycosyltransferase involved in cell wall biosynthesis